MLSLEILVEVFLFTRQPTRISHVCQDWRNVALDTAVLWASAVIQPARDGTLQNFLEKPAEWIKRSKGALLDIHVLNMAGGSSNLLSVSAWKIVQIINLIRPHSQRWRSVTLINPPGEHIGRLMDEFNTIDMPKLELFRVSDLRVGRHAQWTLDLGQKAPKLMDIRLLDGHIVLRRDYVNSLAGMLHLMLTRNTFSLVELQAAEEIYELVKRCPQLQSLHVTSHDDRHLFHGLRRRIKLPPIDAQHLVDFVIDCPRILASLLPLLRLPAVKHLAQPIFPHILPIIHELNSFHNLRTLSINNPYDVGRQRFTDIPPLLANLKSLESLMFYKFKAGDSPDDQWIAQFASICPNLKTMKFDWARAMRLSESAIRRVVEGRIEWGHPLQSLTIEVGSGCEEDDDLPDPSEEWLAWMKAHVPELQVLEKSWTFGHLVD